MKVSFLARLLIAGFVYLFAFAASYVLLDSVGVWQRLPASAVRGLEVLTGLVLLATLAGHLILATGKLPADTITRRG